VTFVLKCAEHVQNHKMADVQVRGCWVESKLDAKFVAALQAIEEVLSDVDLNCAVEMFPKGRHAPYGLTGPGPK